MADRHHCSWAPLEANLRLFPSINGSFVGDGCGLLVTSVLEARRYFSTVPVCNSDSPSYPNKVKSYLRRGVAPWGMSQQALASLERTRGLRPSLTKGHRHLLPRRDPIFHQLTLLLRALATGQLCPRLSAACPRKLRSRPTQIFCSLRT